MRWLVIVAGQLSPFAKAMKLREEARFFQTSTSRESRRSGDELRYLGWRQLTLR